jgi:hypothetical protein
MGNLRTNPMCFTKSSDFDHAVRIAQYMESQAGLGIPWNYPVVGKYLKDCYRRGVFTLRKYKPSLGRVDYSNPTNVLVDREQLDGMVQRRYGLTCDELDALHTPPDKPYVIVGSPLAKVLYEADYDSYPEWDLEQAERVINQAGEANPLEMGSEEEEF